MACHPASQAAIARPPPLPYQDNELHLGPLYELTLRTFSAAKRGPCANDGQRECDTGLGCGARAAGKRKTQNILWLSSSTIVLLQDVPQKFLWEFPTLQENCCKLD